MPTNYKEGMADLATQLLDERSQNPEIKHLAYGHCQ